MPLIPGQRLGPYEIVNALGAGGMGEVYRARDSKLNRDVALKVLPAAFTSDPDRLARFRREAQVLASLNHPNIGGIYGFEDSGSTHALVMELVEGEDLSQRISRGAIPLADALPIARQIADALEAAHEQGIVHRDLKPANIKLREDGTVKVLDFGLAKAFDPATSSGAEAMNSPTLTARATQLGMILGTAAYMAPEQAKGKVVDKRADIWAFGVVLHEMLTGRRLFEAEDISETLAAVLTRDVSAPVLAADLPPRLRALLRDCLVRDPKQRLRDIGDARLVLDKIIAGAPDAAVAPAATPAAIVPAWRRAMPWAIVGVLAAALVTGLALWAPWRTVPVLPLVRLSADLGPDAVAGLRATVAISRDGHRIVFPIRGASGTQQLATRLLDQPTATPLAGTENGEQPFFSPDGQWIAFAADGKLKKVSVLGGAAIILCDATNVRGGGWGEDGTIVAALNTGVGLSRIDDAGGTPQALTKLLNGEGTHRYPQILPGGEAVLFTASTRSDVYEDAAIEALSLKTGQVTTVVRGGYFGRYLAGHLVYMHQDVLFSVPFDLPTLAVRGTPTLLLDDVAVLKAGGAGQFDFSDTGTFVYRSGKASSDAFPVVWLDSAGKAQPLLPKPGRYATPRVSPDGRYLALVVDDGKGQDIYAYDIQRDALSRLTFDPSRSNYWPVWTPDGTHLVYASVTDKTIWWIRADGAGEPQRLLVSKNALAPWSFSSDGRYLSYSETAPDTQADSWILPLDLSNPEHPKAGTPEVFLKTPAIEGAPMLSPDGRWVAYTSDESGRYEVSVRPFHSRIGGKWQISTTGGGYSYWSRDGRSLYYLALDGRIMAVDYTATGESFAAGKPRVWSETLVRATAAGFSPMDLAPDGKRFAVLPTSVAQDDKGSVHVTFLLNFFDYMRRGAAGKK